MSVLVDTGVIVAALNQRAPDHHQAKNGLDAAFSGRYGRVFTTDYVFDEVVTLALKKTRSHETAMVMANTLLGRDGSPRLFDMLMMTGAVFREAVDVFGKYTDQALSFTDATTIAFMRRRGIDQVLSFDRGFDGIVARLAPDAA